MRKFISKSEFETKEIAKQIFSSYKDKYKLFVINGNISAGKTIFSQEIAKLIDKKNKLTSSSFTVKTNYNNLTHYDLYLLQDKISSPEFYSLLNEDLENGYVIIEWANIIKKFKLSNYLEINIDIKNDSTRVISIKEK